MRGPLGAIAGANVIPFPPPAVQGLGTFGGFEFVVQDLTGGQVQDLAAATRGVIQAGNSNPNLRGLFTQFSANDPQYVVRFNREKAKALQVPLNQITAALQVYMGSVYVNDFDFNNRSYRVYVQADKQFRSTSSDIREYYVRAANGTMIPLESLVTIEQAASPQVITHYNLFRSATVDGSAAPGVSSGQAIATVDARRAAPLCRLASCTIGPDSRWKNCSPAAR